MGTGPLIAIDVLLLYLILGPVVLLGIYVLFDSLEHSGTKQKDTSAEKDPALWTNQEIDANGFDGMGSDGGWDRI